MPSDLNRSPDLKRSPDGGRSVPELLSNALSQVSTLFRKEIQLARAELGEKFGEAAGAITPIAAGGAVLLAALVLLLFALASLLVSFGLAVGWAQLIVGAVFALVGYALVRSGLSKLKTSNLMPERTAEQLSRDAQAAKEQVR
jgi:Putative Actinobacterial Holin-X, holin superfamily III